MAYQTYHIFLVKKNKKNQYNTGATKATNVIEKRTYDPSNTKTFVNYNF